MLWTPQPGTETANLEKRTVGPERLDVDQWGRVLGSATTILGECPDPKGLPKKRVGLVIGYVQSGKTLSFTTVTALARDNGFPIVIVLAGAKTNLVDQNHDRLTTDLAAGSYSWNILRDIDMNKVQDLKTAMEDWAAQQGTDKQRGLVLVAMKNKTHLWNLVNAIKASGINNQPCLIIDDEADQGSPNGRASDPDAEPTTIHKFILELQGLLPHHGLLQYTATPQAPLLANVISATSPDFFHLLEPGPDYRGGTTFFRDRTELVITIPEEDVPSTLRKIKQAPDSLKRALWHFLAGVTAGIASKQDQAGKNRSMLVHPSSAVAPHGKYRRWIQELLQEWAKVIGGTDSPAKQLLLNAHRDARADLESTGAKMPPLADMEAQLALACRRIKVTEVNNSTGETVDWSAAYAHIVIGGLAVDRGFTIQGLTVTYMPRGIGVGNVDSILQRARFYGYKAKIIDLCRVYLERDTIDAYRRIIEHEEDIRARLQQLLQEGKPLKEWRRRFLLHDSLRMTREQVYDLRLYSKPRSEWYYDNRPLLSAYDVNRQVIDGFVKKVAPVLDPKVEGLTEQMRHGRTIVNLQQVYEEVLTRVDMKVSDDPAEYTILLLFLKRELDRNPDAECLIVEMAPGAIRERSVDPETGAMTAFFMGGKPGDAQAYAGDTSIYDAARTTVQVHTLTVKREGQPDVVGVKMLAIRPPTLTDDLVAQGLAPKKRPKKPAAKATRAKPKKSRGRKA
jgi:hypothetical protein